MPFAKTPDITNSQRLILKSVRTKLDEIANKHNFNRTKNRNTYTDKIVNGRKIKVYYGERSDLLNQDFVLDVQKAFPDYHVKFGTLADPSWNTPNTVTILVKW